VTAPVGITVPQEASPSNADDLERHPCPRCKADHGSPCRSRSGAVAGTYHTGRFTKVPRLAKLLRVPTPALLELPPEPEAPAPVPPTASPSRARWSERNLRGADLRDAILTSADLRGVDLTGADLREANLIDASLSGANLFRANLTDAILRGANLREVNLTGAHMLAHDRAPGAV
jgi:hypothetical protein